MILLPYIYFCRLSDCNGLDTYFYFDVTDAVMKVKVALGPNITYFFRLIDIKLPPKQVTDVCLHCVSFLYNICLDLSG